MKYPIEQANKLTLNTIQNTLHIHINKTGFLRMIFPETLRRNDHEGLLQFLFDPDSSYQKSRSSFMTGNITASKNSSAYSRAHQKELSYIAEQFNTTDCLKDMEMLLSRNFKNLKMHQLTMLAETDMTVYPPEFRTAVNDSVQNNRLYYLLTLLILWAVFGERISFLSQHYITKAVVTPQNLTLSPYTKIISYFQDNTQDLHNVESVDFAFLAGTRWLTDDERIAFVQMLLRHNIKMRILIPYPDVAENFAKNMRNPDKMYVSFPRIYEMWQQFYQKHADLVEIKLSSIPPLRNYYAFNRKDSMSTILFISYTYGNPVFYKNFTQQLDSASPYYEALKDEFSYLWEMSKQITAET